MASAFPKLPGFVPTHDCTKTDHKKVSHVQLEKNVNPKNKTVPLYALPRPLASNFRDSKHEDSKSFSQSVYKNHFG